MSEPAGILTLAVIVLTSVVSFAGFRNLRLQEQLIFDPERILAGKEFYRLLTSAFLHADTWHLAWNMVALYLFGNGIELVQGRGQFLAIYFGSIAGGSLLSLLIHRHHVYRACGASAGVCGIVFAHLLLFPGSGVRFFFVPFSIPGWVYAPLFLIGSFFALRRGRDNIGHDAHLGGAILGLLLAAALNPQAARENDVVFLAVLGLGLPLLAYFWWNPLLLPSRSLLPSPSRGPRATPPASDPHAEQARLDRILDKIAREGSASLDPDERRFLAEVSAKLRRRGESSKPNSELSI